MSADNASLRHDPAAEKVRLFVALTIPSPVKAALARVHARLQQSVASSQVRWTTPEQWHITLKFLGWTNSGSVDPLRAALLKAAAKVPAIRLLARGIGFFPARGIPRVIWAGVDDGSERLTALQRTVQEATAPFTTEEAEVKFAGHITLGRIKSISRPSVDSLRSITRDFTDANFGEWTAQEIELMRSVLSSRGAKYSCLARVPLG
jgi:2'-5' RNA ligase